MGQVFNKKKSKFALSPVLGQAWILHTILLQDFKFLFHFLFFSFFLIDQVGDPTPGHQLIEDKDIIDIIEEVYGTDLKNKTDIKFDDFCCAIYKIIE
jgi:hypothetical protein